FRRTMPRMVGDNWVRNQQLLAPYAALAEEAGCTPAQLAIAWLLHKGQDIIPIPGTSREDHLLEDLGAADVVLSQDLMQRVEALINQNTVAGGRYTEQSENEVDT